MNLNRRDLLKIGSGVLLSTLLAPFVLAQSRNNLGAVHSEFSESKIDGNISYNAGWVIPLEDKQTLLELEAKKTKEREDVSKQKSEVKSAEMPSPSENSKSITKRFQGILDKIRGLF